MSKKPAIPHHPTRHRRRRLSAWKRLWQLLRPRWMHLNVPLDVVLCIGHVAGAFVLIAHMVI